MAKLYFFILIMDWISDNKVDEINNLFELSKEYDNMELEVRLKGNILKKSNVHRLLSAYDNWTVVEYTEKRNRIIGASSCVHRCINDGNVILKTKIDTVKFSDGWISMVLSTEERVNKITMVTKYFKIFTKKRWSKLMTKNIRLDITYINVEDIWQVEVELLRNTKNKYKDELINCVSKVINILQDSPVYVSRKRFELVKEIVEDLVPNFSVTKHKYQKPRTLDYRGFQQVLSNRNYRMTPKMDGIRVFLVIFNGMVYSVDTNTHVRLLYTGLNTYTSPVYCILDTELVSGKYFIFDIVTNNGSLDNRLIAIDEITKKLKPTNLNFITKTYTQISYRDTVPFICKYWERIKKANVDGIIFIDSSRMYNNYVWKWKPILTVDLFVGEDKLLYSGSDTPLTEYKTNVDDSLVKKIGVYEFKIVNNNGLEMVRYREDKSKPNGQYVIESNIKRGFPLVNVWNGRGCFLLRKYHNYIKKRLLGKNANTLLDIGSGQGGDILKWKSMNVVYCVEPNKQAREEFRKRISELDVGEFATNVSLIKCGIENTNKIYNKIPKNSVDTISIFFCMNLFVNNLDKMFEVISYVASRKCRIVGTFLDADELMEADYSSNCFQITNLTNDNYNITLFDTRVENQTEYKLTMDRIADPLINLGFNLHSSNLLTNNKLSTEESKLTKMYREFTFVRE